MVLNVHFTDVQFRKCRAQTFRENILLRVSVQQARKDMSRLLDAVVSGDQVVITRRNKPVARLIAIDTLNHHGTVQFPDRTEFRSLLPEAVTMWSG